MVFSVSPEGLPFTPVGVVVTESVPDFLSVPGSFAPATVEVTSRALVTRDTDEAAVGFDKVTVPETVVEGTLGSPDSGAGAIGLLSELEPRGTSCVTDGLVVEVTEELCVTGRFDTLAMVKVGGLEAEPDSGDTESVTGLLGAVPPRIGACPDSSVLAGAVDTPAVDNFTPEVEIAGVIADSRVLVETSSVDTFFGEVKVAEDSRVLSNSVITLGFVPFTAEVIFAGVTADSRVLLDVVNALSVDSFVTAVEIAGGTANSRVLSDEVVTPSVGPLGAGARIDGVTGDSRVLLDAVNTLSVDSFVTVVDIAGGAADSRVL